MMNLINSFAIEIKNLGKRFNKISLSKENDTLKSAILHRRSGKTRDILGS